MSPNVLFLTPYEPSPTGNGGNHRAYQIQCDLTTVPGVMLKTLHLNRIPAPPVRRSWRDRLRLRTRLQEWLTRGAQWLVERTSSPRLLHLWTTLRRELDGPRAPYLWVFPLNQASMAEVHSVLEQGTIRLVVFENSGWGPIVKACRARNIPVVCCPQNLESLLCHDHRQSEPQLSTLLHQLQGELDVFQECDHTLFISRVEAGFVGGLRLPAAGYYPYAPAGALKTHLLEIRQARLQNPPEPGLCLLLGSCRHPPVGDGMTWLLEQIAHHKLPPGLRLEVVGKDSEVLARDYPGMERVTWRGWVEDAELHQLLRSAQCVLIPLRYGFGSLTRLAEMATAGIPVIASRFATLAVDDYPHLQAVENRWPDWVEALSKVDSTRPTSEENRTATFNELQILAHDHVTSKVLT